MGSNVRAGVHRRTDRRAVTDESSSAAGPSSAAADSYAAHIEPGLVDLRAKWPEGRVARLYFARPTAHLAAVARYRRRSFRLSRTVHSPNTNPSSSGSPPSRPGHAQHLVRTRADLHQMLRLATSSPRAGVRHGARRVPTTVLTHFTRPPERIRLRVRRRIEAEVRCRTPRRPQPRLRHPHRR